MTNPESRTDDGMAAVGVDVGDRSWWQRNDRYEGKGMLIWEGQREEV